MNNIFSEELIFNTDDKDNLFEIKNLSTSPDIGNIMLDDTDKDSVRFFSLNVCGLVSKLDFIECSEFIHNSDVIFFTETKTDITSESIVSDFFDKFDFEVRFKHRKQFSTFKSGGIAICIKRDLFKHFKIVNTKCPFVLWCSIEQKLFGLHKDILIGGVYTPPEGTQYASQYCFADIENEIINLNCNDKYHVMLSGDFNAHIGVVNDLLENEYETNEDTNFSFSNTYNLQENIGKDTDCSNILREHKIPIKRSSQDKSRVNNFGHSLIDFCKSLSLVILNGRMGNDMNLGKITNIKAKTTVDYFISDPELLRHVAEFEVCDFDPNISDLHCPLFLSIKTNRKSSSQKNPVKNGDQETCINNMYSKIDSNCSNSHSNGVFKWCENCRNMKEQDIVIEHDDIVQLETIIDNSADVDEMYNAIKDTMFDSCVKCGFAKIIKTKRDHFKCNSGTCQVKSIKDNKIWFNDKCRQAKVNYDNARKLYSNFKKHFYENKVQNDPSVIDEQELIRLEGNVKLNSNLYKSTIRKARKEHRKQISKTVINTRAKDPKTFWKFINPKKHNKEIPLNLEDLKNHFSKLSENQNPDEDEKLNDLNMLINEFQDDDISGSILNNEFSTDELLKVVKKLKTCKAAGEDNVINEVIVQSFDKLKTFWCKLFNRILETGEIPKDWLNGLIVPIYKNKGDKKDPGNYRGITLLSCSANFFTAVLNERLRTFSDICEILEKNQAGFRTNHSTTDHIFVLKSLTDIIRSRKNKLFCAFVDYEKAFDKVWHTGLWVKLLKSGIGGKILNVMINMYKGITSCVSVNGYKSLPFAIHQGVRQGENLSPLLFALYVNDLEDYLKANGCNPIDLNFDDRILNYFKILCILYADDTVIFANSEFGLQKALDSLENYCKIWRLNINCSKTKILIFCGKKSNYEYPFKLNNQLLEHVSSYKYLGITFSFNGKFNNGVKELKDQGRRAMFSLLQKSRFLQLDIAVQIELFNSLVRPIITYGCEVWGYSCIDIIESLQLEFLKYILHVKKSTPNCFVYGETGQYPIYIHVYSRLIKYWHKIQTDNNGKLSSSMLKTLNECHDFNIFHSEYLIKVKKILDDCGLSFVWLDPKAVNTDWLSKKINSRLQDIFIQSWRQQTSDCNKSCNYNLYKPNFGIEKYLVHLPWCYRVALTKLRTANHKLPIEKGRYRNLPREERKCSLCDLDRIGDEFHFLLECKKFDDIRAKYLPKHFYVRPNYFKYSQLLSTHSKKKLLNLGKFIKEGLCSIK